MVGIDTVVVVVSPLSSLCANVAASNIQIRVIVSLNVQRLVISCRNVGGVNWTSEKEVVKSQQVNSVCPGTVSSAQGQGSCLVQLMDKGQPQESGPKSAGQEEGTSTPTDSPKDAMSSRTC